MDENTKEAMIAKYLVIGVCALASLASGTCAYVNHEENVAKVEVETRKVTAASAERDRAMFEGMNRAAQAKP